MQKIDMVKINRSNKDIWQLLKMAIETNNIALIESSLERMYSLQKYYIDLLNFQDMEINRLKDHLTTEQKTNTLLDNEWVIEIAKRNTTQYENFKERIRETYSKV
jgi:hypothetical protein